jgi:peptidoglycan hydrolase-like protein with peptidoglycan-binding domain
MGNNSEGGMVMRRERKRSMVRAFASPKVLGNISAVPSDGTMQKGQRGADVASMQKMLHDLNYDITVDGFYGNETVAIVKRFQSDHQLDPTGIVTPALLGFIEGEVNQPRVPAKKLTTGSYLRKGNSGAAVVDLQKALNIAGANPAIKENGVFDGNTVAALKSFQSKKGLTIDGVAGPQTFSALGIKNI